MTRIRPLTRPRRLATAVVGILALVATLVGTASLTAAPATSAPGAPCAATFPEGSLRAGDPLTGLTVTTGTVPETFEGQVLGIYEDALAPGRDLVMVDLHSTTIDRVGIWEGMSGSPVYAADGRLVGAVAWGLSEGPSTVVGLTPAADLRALLTGAASSRSTSATTRSRVVLPPALAARIVRSGAATASEVAQGVRPLRVPLGVSGVSPARLRQLAPGLHVGRTRLAAVPAGRTSAERIDVTTGGNLAASLAYGVISGTGLGTATLVCGNQVVGFGHPFNFTGRSTMSLHGARALFVQDNSIGSPFKVANIGAPIGTVNGDRLAGIHAVKGPLPTGRDVSSVAIDRGVRHAGASHVTVPEVVPIVAVFNMVSVQDQALDEVSGGTAWAGWTITGERRNGRPFEFRRKNLYADSADVSSATAIGLDEDLSTIVYNESEAVRITSVKTESHLGGPYEAYSIRKVQARILGRWVGSSEDRPLPVRAGTVARLKVFLTSREGDPRILVVRVFVPSHAAGRVGTLHLVGGNDGESDEFFDDEDEGESSATLPQVLKSLAAGPQNNQVVATLRFRTAPGAAKRPHTRVRTINRVVGGDLTVPVVALP